MNKFKEYKEYIAHLNEASEIQAEKDIYFIGPKEKESEIKKVLKEFDWFTFAIDDNSQRREVEAQNKEVLSDLKKLGCSKILHKNFSSPMAGKYTKVIDL